MQNISNLILAAGTIATGLLAGLFFSFSVAVIPGLTRLPDAGYLQAFQQINVAILNPVFLLCFMAPVILLPGATWLQYKQGGPWIWMLAAALVYIIAVFGVTAGGNVPLNDVLAKTDLTNATSTALSGYRAAFEPAWNKFHNIRTIANIVSLALCIYVCINTVKNNP
ncbi:DUF1772 domain-containing protein [Pseudoflavitalea sp. G-6-1-2]|uniref:anthrone oxygenase family protein n=1 Tax=Pseudoflavitalea sp. G-6-1-2 TaxID=2728841 RepID=UPI00146E5453|nr:anthrone oxygenase family protein [Pseudoflavitalea sp. G-6-1-2]NML19569.1 DUF1772 domain-containing protein [Pseudoflavitalea sp. G-6-1-2]